MILFYDTETSGKYDFNKPTDHPSQPDLMQIALLMADDTGRTRATFSALVCPSWKYQVSPEAHSVHGLSFEDAGSAGVRWMAIYRVLRDFSERCDLVVAHNEPFDSAIVSTYFSRLIVHVSDLLVNPLDRAGIKRFCTMEASTNVLKLPGKYPGKFKWPKLQEAYRFLFDRDFEGAHDAMSDVKACKEVYFALRDCGLLT